MAIKKISQFTAGIPTSADKILFEQDGAGKSTTIGDAVNTCSLTLEEIQATTDLTGKIASANALKSVDRYLGNLKIVYQQNVSVNFSNSIESDIIPKPANAISIISVCPDNGGCWSFVKYAGTFRVRHVDSVTLNNTFIMDIVWACIR